MRTTIDLAEDAAFAARTLAHCERMSLGEAISELIRRGAAVGAVDVQTPVAQPLRGRFALLPSRGAVITPQHVRALMERAGI